jgi:hypothetical protein
MLRHPTARAATLPLFLLLSQSLPSAVISVGGVHVHTDSFPTHDEYDIMALDPETPYGTPYGGFSRATASRLASLPLRLPNTAEELHEFDPTYMTVRDSQGRPFACRVYHEDELEAASLKDSLFDMPVLASRPVPTPDNDDDGNDDSEGKKGDVDDQNEVEAGTTSAVATNEMTADSSEDDGDGEQRRTAASSVSEEEGDSSEAGEESDGPRDEKLGPNFKIPSSRTSSVPTTVEAIMNDVVPGNVDDAPASTSDAHRHSQASGPTDSTNVGTATGNRPQPYWQDQPIQIIQEISRRVSQFDGLCAQLHPNWWSYEWCHQEKVTQFHVQVVSANPDASIQTGNKKIQEIKLEDIASLGTYSERKILTSFDLKAEETGGLLAEDDGTTKTKRSQELDFTEGRKELGRVIDTFIDGAICPETNKPRQTEVTLRCCSDRILTKTKGGILKNHRPLATDLLTIAQVKEDRFNVCHYSITICTPLLCADVDDTSFESGQATIPTTPVGSTSSAAGTIPAPSGKSDIAGMKHKIQLDLDPAEVEKMSVAEVLERSFGKSGTLCFQSGTGGWWVYEFCPGEYIRQFHENTVMDRVTGHVSSSLESEHILGRYIAEDHESVSREDEWMRVVNATDPTSSLGPSWSGGKSKGSRQARTTRLPSINNLGGNGAYYHQEYTRGDLCDHEDVTDSAIKAGAFGEGGIERATTVRYSCGKYLEMTVREDSTCHYIVDISVPSLCHHPLFKAPVSKKQVVKCLPLFHD